MYQAVLAPVHPSLATSWPLYMGSKLSAPLSCLDGAGTLLFPCPLSVWDDLDEKVPSLLAVADEGYTDSSREGSQSRALAYHA